MEDKRKFPRLPLDVEVNFQKNAIARSKDISEGGLCIIAEDEYEVNKINTMVFTLPSGEKIKTMGKIVRARQASEHLFEYGVEFWDIEDEDSKTIKEFFESQE
jgi:c-di-GMP-binding flagellar brake protein YcgR